MSNRDTVLSMLEEISESPEADDYFELEKNYGNDIHWMLGAAKDKNIKRAVRDTKSRALEGTLNLALEDSNGVDYSSLMNQYKRAFKWGLRFSKSAKIRGKIKELKRRALVETAKKLSKDEQANPFYVRKHHTGLLDASRTVYNTPKGVEAWSCVIEDARIVLPNAQRKWSLKVLFDKLEELGNEPKDFRHKELYERDAYISTLIGRRFGKYGKAVLMIGVDYLSLPKVRKPGHEFSVEDFKTLMDDDSLSDERKIAYAFNAICLQYYRCLDVSKGFSERVLDSGSNCFGQMDESYLRGNLSLGTLYECEHYPISWSLSGVTCNYRTRVELSPDIPNRFHRADFCFRGVDGDLEEKRFKELLYEEIKKI